MKKLLVASLMASMLAAPALQAAEYEIDTQGAVSYTHLTLPTKA